MKKFVLVSVLMALIASVAYGTSGSPGLKQPADVKFLLNDGSPGSLRAAQAGTQLIDKKLHVMKAQYSFATLGGASSLAGAVLKLKDVDGKDAVLPNKSVIKQVIIDVLTAPVASAATGFTAPKISLGVNDLADLKASTLATSYTSILAGTPVGTAATAVKTTGKSAVIAQIVGGSVTAGKFNVFIEYYLSD